MDVKEGFEKFKATILKDVPEFIGSVEMYNRTNKCYCTVGLALKNLGFDLADPNCELPPETAGYGIFDKEFGLRLTPVGCMSDDIVRGAPNSKRVHLEAPIIAPASEVLDKLFVRLELHLDALASYG